MNLVMNQTIKKYNLIKQDDCIVVAVSGGADSMALLHYLMSLKQRMNLNLIVAHVNHQTRLSNVDDETLVKAVAKSYQLPCVIYDLPRDEVVKNFHAYAREKRYAFFMRVAKQYKATKIATAHHLDDQLETFIHRLLYYNSLSSLVGILPRVSYEQYEIIRPMIDMTKVQVYDYCQSFDVQFLEDESNERDQYTRNRIRHHIIPALIDESESVYDHVQKISEQIDEDERYFKTEVSKLKKWVTIKGNDFLFSRSWFVNLPKSLSLRLLKLLLSEVTTETITHVHMLEILKVSMSSKQNSSVSLPCGVSCLIEYDTIRLSTEKHEEKFVEKVLQFNESIVLPTGHLLSINVNKVGEKTENSCINEVHLCYNEVELPLRIRGRKPGDKVKLINGAGHKKVKEIMIEAKVPKRLRETWPIIVDNRDEIVWIPLLKKTSYCRQGLDNDIIRLTICNSEG